MFKPVATLMILTLAAMLICPALPASTPTQSTHPCQEKPQKNSSEKMHVCCDQQAVASKNVRLPDGLFVMGFLSPTMEIALDLYATSPGIDFILASWKPHDLTTLSILRI